MQVEIRFKKCGISNQPDVCICDDPCLSKFGALRGCMSASRRQWADFLVSLMAPLHRQYNTARTETRRHLLLKIRQMPTQTSASRGYVLFRGANKGHTRKSYKLSPGCGHAPVGLSKRGRDTESDANIQPEEMLTFFSNEFPSAFPHEIPKCVSCNITYQTKARYASCDTSSIFISIQCFSAMRYTPSPSNAGMKLSSAVSPS